MTLAEPLLGEFEKQAIACERLGSPFTAALCRLMPQVLDRDTATGRLVHDWAEGPDAALPLRLAGALHRLVLAGADAALASVYPPNPLDTGALAAAVARAFVVHDAEVAAFLASPPQTNEVARSAALLPGLLLVARQTARPIVLAEIGSSAGLNLSLDRFSYDFGGALWGDAASGVQLRPDLRGAVPDLAGDLAIVSRRGCDISPVPLETPEARLRLRSYVWADQAPRLARLGAAIDIARDQGVVVERCDAADFVRDALANRPADAAFCLMHSIMWQYMPERTKAAITEAMRAAGAEATADRPLAWLRLEPDGAGEGAAISLDLWPGGETRQLGRADFHGRWLDWRA